MTKLLKKKIKEKTTNFNHFKSPNDLTVFMKEPAKHCSFIKVMGFIFSF